MLRLVATPHPIFGLQGYSKMSLPNAALQRLTTADGQQYSTITHIYFDKERVPMVNENGAGGATVLQDAAGRIAVSDLDSVLWRSSGLAVNVVLPESETWATPAAFINARIAELQAEIVELQAILAGLP